MKNYLTQDIQTSELSAALAEVKRVESIPTPDNIEDRVRWRMKIQGALRRLERAHKVIELEGSK